MNTTISHCPHCNVLMEPYGHDDYCFYKCHNDKTCPINFQMDVWYPADTQFPDEEKSHVHKGMILNFTFEIDDLYCRVQSSSQRRGAFSQAQISWDLDPVFHLSRTHFEEGKPFWSDSPNKTEMRKKWTPIFEVPFNFDIDWKNPQAFKDKLKIWMTFS